MSPYSKDPDHDAWRVLDAVFTAADQALREVNRAKLNQRARSLTMDVDLVIPVDSGRSRS